MIRKQLAIKVAAFLTVALGTSSALAGLCQTTSSGWAVQQFCGVTSRGYAQGTNNAFGTGQKGLAALSTGISGGSSSVTAVGLNSAGQQLTGCWASDDTEDGSDLVVNGAWAVGGSCQQGVNFIIQITY
jgi:hypothetical protein